MTYVLVCYSLILIVVPGRARSAWAGLGVAGGDGARGGVAGGAGRSNRWKAVMERHTAQASAALNRQAASKKEIIKNLIL